MTSFSFIFTFMPWSLKDIHEIADDRVRQRLLKEWQSRGGASINGDKEYWYRIVHNKQVDYRQRPYLYHVGRGHQGVMSVEPYKSEIHPFYSITDSVSAFVSASSIYLIFLEYIEQRDFVGADIARKFLSMGRMRCKYFANRMMKKKSSDVRKGVNEKLEASLIFQYFHHEVRGNGEYLRLKERHKKIRKEIDSEF